MKETLFDVLSSAEKVNRRSFVKFGAAGLGALASASTALAFPRRTYLPPTPPPPAEAPLATLTFEVAFRRSSAHHAAYVAGLHRSDPVARFRGQVVQAQLVQRNPAAFHQQYWSDYGIQGQIAPTRTRYGYYMGVRTNSPAATPSWRSAFTRT